MSNLEDQSELFLALTPNHVLQAVEEGGYEPSGHVNALHCFENRVHDIRLDDGDHIITKFYRPGRWSREQIQEEHDFLFELRSAEIPVCAPLKFEDGESIHEIEGIYYAVWPRVGGRSPSELNDEQIEILGRLLARIHNVGSSHSEGRLELNEDSYGLQNLEFLLTQNFISPVWENRFETVVRKICEHYSEVAQDVPTHRIHGDCHYGNLLNGREGWFFVDFDDMLIGPAVQDVWLLLPGQDQYAKEQRNLFIEAYRQFRPFEQRWLKLIEPLRALRIIRYAAWIARRWHDPAFPAAFSHFGTEQYWQRETIDLEQQFELIQREFNLY
ncbi:MAG: serine/threonine protein kinase [Myxococcota bacterium]|nr:serine/threonine protein kinase [Myxococcota bacterium]